MHNAHHRRPTARPSPRRPPHLQNDVADIGCQVSHKQGRAVCGEGHASRPACESAVHLQPLFSSAR